MHEQAAPEPVMERITAGLWRFGPVYIRDGDPNNALVCEVVRNHPGADRLTLAELVNTKLRETTGHSLENDDLLVRRWVGHG